MIKNEPNKTWNNNIKILQSISEKLRNEDDLPDIDSYVDYIEQAKSAFFACKERFEQVKAAIDKCVAEPSFPGQQQSSIDKISENPAHNNDYDDDIPF